MRRFAIATALTLFSTAAFAQDVKVDFDKNADFSKYKSFALKIGTRWNNEISESRVENEFKQTLVEKGWRLEDPDKADTIVVLHGATDKQKTLNTFYTGGGAYGGYGWRGVGYGGMGMGSSSTTVSEYMVGTLVADIFDAKTKSLIFRGIATDEISDKADKNIKKIDKAATKMFKDFPPGSKKKK